MTAVVAFSEAFLETDTAVLRAALSEPDDDAYLAVVARASSFYAPAEGNQVPFGPQAGRFAVPGRRSDQMMPDPGERAGKALVGVGRITAREGWLAFVSAGYDPEGVSLGAALLIEVVDGELRVTGRADVDPFVEGIGWVPAGGRPVPVDAPTEDTRILRRPRDLEHAAWLAERLGS